MEWCDVLRARHGYPVYLMGYERTLRLTLESLGAIANLFFAGRQGFFKYMDMDLAMKSGFETAAAILTERPRISLDAIAHQDRLSF